MAQLDWAAMLRFAVRQRGMTPAAFWALTPAELMLMVGEGSGTRPLTRNRLMELQAAFPDRRPGDTAPRHEKDNADDGCA